MIVESQIEGPLRAWRHRQRIEIAGSGHCQLIDEIEFEPPGGMLGYLLTESRIRQSLEEGMDFRYDILQQLITSGAIDVCQIDSCRVAGVNEILGILLMAAKYKVPVCPHAGGVGLCEYVQHLSMFDYIAITGTTEDRMIEYVDHLHEHFLDPVLIRDGSYMPPTKAGYSIEIKKQSLVDYEFPKGKIWENLK